MQKAKNLFLALLASVPLLAPLQAQSQVVSGAKRLDLGATPLTGEVAATGTVTAPSDLTAPKIPVAASATTVADSDLSYYVGKLDSAEPVNGRKLCFTDSQSPPNVYCLVTSDPSRNGGLVFTTGSAEGSAQGVVSAFGLRLQQWLTAGTTINIGDTIYMPDDGFDPPGGMWLKNGVLIRWPLSGAADTQIARDAAGQVGIYGAGSTYGQLYVGTIQLVDTGTRPTCDAAHRGQVWYGAGAGGVADAYAICGKSAADSYSWVSLATF